ncbi:hypothetical protein H4Q26_013071 [Puccinia striiformis f. sp. tritici PST-130]|nr:hypothetical protein H4Q26_013071 [Puccinia striiformis f. sp. tritici PST-130]
MIRRLIERRVWNFSPAPAPTAPLLYRRPSASARELGRLLTSSETYQNHSLPDGFDDSTLTTTTLRHWLVRQHQSFTKDFATGSLNNWVVCVGNEAGGMWSDSSSPQA